MVVVGFPTPIRVQDKMPKKRSAWVGLKLNWKKDIVN